MYLFSFFGFSQRGTAVANAAGLLGSFVGFAGIHFHPWLPVVHPWPRWVPKDACLHHQINAWLVHQLMAPVLNNCPVRRKRIIQFFVMAFQFQLLLALVGSTLSSVAIGWARPYGPRGVLSAPPNSPSVVAGPPGANGRKEWWKMIRQFGIRSGKLTYSYWKWWFIVDLPTQNGDFPWLC